MGVKPNTCFEANSLCYMRSCFVQPRSCWEALNASRTFTVLLFCVKSEGDERAQEYNDKNNVDIIPIVDCKVGICATL